MSLYFRNLKLSIISFVFVTIIAPCFNNLLVPTPFLSPISCGGTKTFLFCSIAYLAVTLVPLLCIASTIRTPIDKPLTILFLSKNFFDVACFFGEYSLKTKPLLFIISWNNFLFSSGYIFSKPHGKTAIVFPCSSNTALCAIESIPIAIPLTIVIPCFTNSFANFLANISPYSLFNLEPIIAIIFVFSNSIFPL